MLMIFVHVRTLRQILRVVFLSHSNDASHWSNTDVTEFIARLESFNRFPTIAPVLLFCPLSYRVITDLCPLSINVRAEFTPECRMS